MKAMTGSQQNVVQWIIQHSEFSPRIGHRPQLCGVLIEGSMRASISHTTSRVHFAGVVGVSPGRWMRFGRPLTTTLSRDAKVLSFGDGSHGALGHTDCFGGDAYEPEEVAALPEDIASVGAGHYHSLAVSRTGELWAWGRNSEGQLGERDEILNSREKWHVPQRVRGLESVDVTSARGSGVVSMAVAKDGSLWAWGKSKRGQLGLGPGLTQAAVPQRVEALSGKRVVQVALGWGHALALTAEGHVYSWGYAANCRLGFQSYETPSKEASSDRDTGEGVEDVAYRQVLADMEKERSPVLAWEPIRVDSLGSHGVTEIRCGMDHSLTLNEQGEVWSFGDNSLGQLGRLVVSTTVENCVERVQGPLSKERVLQLGAGLGHSLAVVAPGRVYSWGWHQGSALPECIGAEEFQAAEVAAVAGGRAHSVSLTSEGQVWVWGSGKNGRLGLGSPSDAPSPFPVESLGSCIVDAACGFDHTLVLVPSI